MNKRALVALLRRQRGSQVLPAPFQHIEEMDEREAGQWLRLLRNMVEDAEREGERKGARHPFRRGWRP